MSSNARPAVVLACMCAAVLAFAIGASADPLRVVLIGRSENPTLTRMRDELAVLGLDVRVEPPSSRDLAEAARAVHAAAAARIEERAPAAVVVWVDPVFTAGRTGELRVEDIAGHPEAALLALRAVELLRGKLIPVPPGAPGPDGSAPPLDAALADAPAAQPAAPAAQPIPEPSATAPVREAPTSAPREARGPAPRRASLFFAPALLAMPGGLSPVPTLRIGAAFTPVRRAAFEAIASIPTLAAAVDRAEGDVSLRTLLFGAEARLFLSDPTAPLCAAAGAGIAAAVLWFDGSAADSAWVGQSGNRWVAAPFLTIGAAYRIAPLVAVRAELLAALFRPEPVVRIADASAATVGEPALLGAVGLEVWP